MLIAAFTMDLAGRKVLLFVSGEAPPTPRRIQPLPLMPGLGTATQGHPSSGHGASCHRKPAGTQDSNALGEGAQARAVSECAARLRVPQSMTAPPGEPWLRGSWPPRATCVHSNHHVCCQPDAGAVRPLWSKASDPQQHCEPRDPVLGGHRTAPGHTHQLPHSGAPPGHHVLHHG